MRYDRRHGKGGARKYSVVKKLRAKYLFNFKKSKTFNRRMKKSGGPFHRISRGGQLSDKDEVYEQFKEVKWIFGQIVLAHEEEAPHKQQRMEVRLWNYVSTFSILSGEKLCQIYSKLKQLNGSARPGHQTIVFVPRDFDVAKLEAWKSRRRAEIDALRPFANDASIPEPSSCSGILSPLARGPFLQICKGKSVLKPSNYNTDQMDAEQVSSTDQMDVDQARTIQFQDEIIMDILSRLPMRYLLQSKCVSKLWYALISDPYFRMMHLKRAKNDRSSQKLLIITLSPTEDIFSCYRCPLSPVQADNDVQKLVHPSRSKRIFSVECCCDGLAVVMVSDSYEDVRPILLLWNPSTNESVELPSPEFLGESSMFGMGFDSTSSDYKIFIVNNGEGDCALTSGILSLKGGSWRKFDKHPDIMCNKIYYMDDLAFVHETFHWIGLSRNQSLVSFSISSEVYGEVAMPEEILRFEGSMSIGVTELDEMLCVYSTFLYQGRMSYKSWVLKDYGVKECWSALFTVEDPDCFIVPKYRFADGDVLFWCSHIPSKGGQTFQTCSGPFGNWSRGGMQMGYTFTESLISPKLQVVK